MLPCVIIAPTISIHALLAESDVHYDNYNLHCVISIHALLAESDAQYQHVKPVLLHISIHALLAESDSLPSSSWGFMLISIHALLAESDTVLGRSSVIIGGFLSTLSLRRATGCQRPCGRPTRDFYPRSPCGERLLPRSADCNYHSISIHALLAESDGLPAGSAESHW